MEFMLTLWVERIDSIHSDILHKRKKNNTLMVNRAENVCVHVNGQQNDKLKLKLPFIYRMGLLKKIKTRKFTCGSEGGLNYTI